MDYLSAIVAFVVTTLFILLLRPVATKVNLVDTPGGRKKHKGCVPLIGGIAMFGGFSFALLTLNISLSAYRSLIAALLVIVCIGLLDDFKELSAKKKLLAQILVALIIIVWGGAKLTQLGNLLFVGPIHLGFLSIPFTLMAIIGLMNAINMLDGLDGLAGTITLGQLILLYSLTTSYELADGKILVVVISGLIAFLCFNFPGVVRRKNKVFMGDAGSLFLGLILVWFCIKLTQGQHPRAHPVTMLWIMALPLMDTSAAIIRRLRKGLSPFYADRAHFHHVFLYAGYSNFHTVCGIALLSLLMGMIGIIGERLHISETVMFLGLIVVFVIYLYAVNHAWRIAKTIRRRALHKPHDKIIGPSEV